MRKDNRIEFVNKEPAQECVGSFDEDMKLREKNKRTSMHIGNTTYLVGIYFGKDEKEALEDKIKSLILRDIQNGKIL